MADITRQNICIDQSNHSGKLFLSHSFDQLLTRFLADFFYAHLTRLSVCYPHDTYLEDKSKNKSTAKSIIVNGAGWRQHSRKGNLSNLVEKNNTVASKCGIVWPASFCLTLLFSPPYCLPSIPSSSPQKNKDSMGLGGYIGRKSLVGAWL